MENDARIHLLQGGAAKSGNLWLYKIIEHIFSHGGIEQNSFVQDQSIYPVAKTWPLSYPGQVDIDMLDIENEQCYWRISTIFRMPVESIEEYISATSHAWTHSRICNRSQEVYPLFDKVVYIIRDPRDRAVSEAKFAFSDYMQRFSPCAENSFSEYLDNNLEEMMSRWRWHVYDHIKFAEQLGIHIVFYERLLHDFEQEFEKLLDYLEIDLSEKDKRDIAQKVTFSSMEEEHPDHLRKGTAGDWKNHFSDQQHERALSIIHPLVSYLNYDSNSLPILPDYVDSDFLSKNLNAVSAETVPG